MLPGPRPPRPAPVEEEGGARWVVLEQARATPPVGDAAGERAPIWSVGGATEASTPPRDPSDPAPRLVEAVLVSAETLKGAPYLYGGEAPGTGFDCSGFVSYVYALHGVPLPRTSRAQARFGEPVAPDPGRFRPGDLLFFATSGDDVDHVALYAGDGRLLHASSTGGDVREDDLGGPGGAWLLDRLVTVRRVVD